MRKRTVKLWRLHEDGRKLFAGTIEAADPRELVLKWSAFLATAERGTYFAHLSRQLRGVGAGAREQRYPGCLTVRPVRCQLPPAVMVLHL
jgi:hypothetical protein